LHQEQTNFVIKLSNISLFGTKPGDWLGRTSPKWPILCEMGRKTWTQSISQTNISQ